MAGAGFTPEAIDAMPMDDALALLDWWGEHPPAGEILMAVYGVKTKPRRDPDDPSGIGAMMARWPGGSVGQGAASVS